MKKSLLIFFSVLIPFISSCRTIGEAIAVGVAEGLTEVIVQEIVAKMINEAEILSLSIEAYYHANETWPQNHADIFSFCESKNWEFPASYWATCENIQFAVQADDSIEITYTRKGDDPEGKSIEGPVSLKMSVPSCNYTDIDKKMADLLIERDSLEKKLSSDRLSPAD